MNILSQKIIPILCALILMLSLCIHTVQVNHEHYGASAQSTVLTHSHAQIGSMAASDAHSHATQSASLASIGEKMHMADKKLILFILGASLFFFSLQFRQWDVYTRLQKIIYTKISFLQKRLCTILYSYIRHIYSLGILNPKLY